MEVQREDRSAEEDAHLGTGTGPSEERDTLRMGGRGRTALGIQAEALRSRARQAGPCALDWIEGWAKGVSKASGRASECPYQSEKEGAQRSNSILAFANSILALITFANKIATEEENVTHSRSFST